ncbi:MAG: hypothetical protein ABSD77_00380 [Verrucomicrobiota bacterium]|jgi:hypothetical protein
MPELAPNAVNGETVVPNTTVENTEAMPSAAPTEPSSPTQPQGPQAPPEKSLSQIYGEFWALINGENPLAKRKELCECVSKILTKAISLSPAYPKYNWLIIHDPLTMLRTDTDKIYKAINSFKQKREIGLIITSAGGEIEPAYLISKLCRESTTEKFIAVVPRRAKSAATLLCCGADEIHMGQMSELGPIDPQFNDLPALGLKNAVQHVAELASQYPKASDMFAKYLSSSLNLVNLGYYERVAESAVQYAERLLKKRVSPLKGNPQDVAIQLVYGYKDHGFVIDRMEAESIFGDSMIKSGEGEYDLGNAVYEWLSLMETACDSAGYGFYMYGRPDSEASFYKKKR